MLCKTDGDKYTILLDNERFPFQLDKRYIDSKLDTLSSMFNAISDELHGMYETDKDLYDLVVEEVLEPWGIHVTDGFSKLDYAADALPAFKKTLEVSNDYIPEREDIILLSDLGFRAEITSYKTQWLKTIKDERTVEIAEEIIIREDDFLHRIRTIKYKETDFGRSSTSIVYEDVKEQTPELLAAIRNTRREVFGC